MIYFSDNFNFQEKNFPELFHAINKKGVKFRFDSHNSSFKKSWGVYKNSDNVLLIDVAELKRKQYKNYNVFSIAKYEILAACATTNEWKQIENSTEDQLWIQILNNFPEIVSGCFKAAEYWITYWQSQDLKKIDIGISFGGSLIYSRAFSEVLKRNNISAFCLEHFFTGNDFYLEEKYLPLPNNSIIKQNKFIDCANNKSNLDSNKESYLEKIFTAKNKNVKQPTYSKPKHGIECLLLAQVSNDFSILSDSNPYKNSIQFYKDFIDIFLIKHSGVLAIKTHPYEDKKLPAGVKTTYEELKKYININFRESMHRIHLYEEKSLNGLIDACKFAVVLNSQSGLEVALRGKPLICFGEPFYGRKGFTYDYDSLECYAQDSACFTYTHEMLFRLDDYLDEVFTYLVGVGEVHKVDNLLNEKVINDKEKTLKTEKKEIARSAGKKFLASDKYSNSSNAINDTNIKNQRKYRLLMKLIKDPKQYVLDSKSPFLKMLAARVNK